MDQTPHMEKPKTPEITEGLLKYLDQRFPDRCPEPSHKARRIWMAAGAREVIRHLQALYKEQHP